MAIQFNCPGCGHLFRVGDEMAGRKGKCPKCGIIIQIPLADGSMPAPAPSPIAPAPAPVAPAQSLRKQPAPKAVEEDEVVEEAAVEEGVVEEAAPEAPKGGKKRSFLLPAIIGGAVLLMSCCTCVPLSVWWYWFTNGTLGSEKKYFPTDTQMVFSVQVDQGMESDLFKKVKGDLKADDFLDDKKSLQEMGLPLSNIKRVTFASGPNNSDPVIIVRTRKSVKGGDIKSAMDKKKFEEVTFLSNTIYEMTEGGKTSNDAFCVVESDVVIYADIKTIKVILDRGKAPEMTASMQKALSNTNFNATATVSVDMKSIQAAAERKNKGQASSEAKQAAQMAGVDEKVFAKVEAVSVSLTVTTDVYVYAVVECKDSSGAEDIKKNIDTALSKAKSADMPGDVKDAMNDIKPYQSGSSVTIKVTIKGDTIAKATKGGVPMGMFGGMGGGGGQAEKLKALQNTLSQLRTVRENALQGVQDPKQKKQIMDQFKEQENDLLKQIEQAKKGQ
jgi:hypothetical protein